MTDLRAKMAKGVAVGTLAATLAAGQLPIAAAAVQSSPVLSNETVAMAAETPAPETSTTATTPPAAAGASSEPTPTSPAPAAEPTITAGPEDANTGDSSPTANPQATSEATAPATATEASPAPQPTALGQFSTEALDPVSVQDLNTFFESLNAYRRLNGVPAVALNSTVSADAQNWANAQADFPKAEPVPLENLPAAAKYGQVTGTVYNAAGPTAKQLHDQLVKDFASTSAQTMRDPKYSEVGIAAVRSGLNLYVYEVFLEKAAETFPTDYVHYSWSPAIYSVSYTWSGMVWKKLEYADWAAAGFPAPRIAGWIPGTRVFTFAPAPEIYATSADGVTHLLTYREWQDMGYKQPERTSGTFVKYPWSGSIYSVEFSSPAWVWKRLSYPDWQQLGMPQPRIAGFIQGTTYYQYYGSGEIFAKGEDSVIHKMSLPEFEAAGTPSFARLTSAYYKTSWSGTIYYNANVNVEGSRPIGYAEWTQAQFPTPSINEFVPFSFYWKFASSGNIYYRSPGGQDILMTYQEWQRAGTPWPRPYTTKPAAGER